MITALAAALLRLATVWVTPEAEPVYVRWCRELPQGCETHARELARLSWWAGDAYGVPPGLLMAVALHESAGNPRARGSVGEYGPWQLHPRSPHGRAVLALCEADREHCLEYQARAAAWLLATHREDCGSRVGAEWEWALRAYNSGRCRARVSRGYARAVLGRWCETRTTTRTGGLHDG